MDHSTPWGKIFTSMSFLSLMLVHCAHNWGFWTLLTKIPSYMKTVLEFDIKQVSVKDTRLDCVPRNGNPFNYKPIPGTSFRMQCFPRYRTW